MLEENAYHRPRYHLSQTVGYLNDPNGPVEIDGKIHLFFQSRPSTDTAVPVEWGHATSDDLVHWTVHPVAMYPTADGLDAGGCWSGNTLRIADELGAFYSGHEKGRPLERLLGAWSHDGGVSFGPPELLLADPEPTEGVRMLRDPFVWRSDGELHMVAGSTVGDHAAIRRYGSSDGGRTWCYAGELASLPRSVIDGADTGEGWECPQIIRVDQQEVALVGAWSFAGGPSGVLAFPVDRPEQAGPFDSGDSFYAPSVMRESSHGGVVFGWLRETRAESWWQEAGWAGAISLPRRLWLTETPRGVSVRSEPVAEVYQLRSHPVTTTRSAELPAQAEVVLNHVSQTVRLRFGDNEHLIIALDLEEGSVVVQRSSASRDERAHCSPIVVADSFDADADRPAARVFLDGSIIEVFTSAGRSASTRIYPLSPPPWHIDGTTEFQLWHLGASISAIDGNQQGSLTREFG